MSIAIEAAQLVKTYPAGGKRAGGKRAAGAKTADGKKTGGKKAAGKKETIRALDGLDLTVPAGVVFGLLGPNGAGKSTAVKVLTSLARPDSGDARVAGIDVLREPGRVRHVIGVVAQRSGADPGATGRENLLLQGHLYGMRGTAVRQRADELLDHFRLTDAAGRMVRTYSGGMQRRLDVAIGLMHRPSVLFLDEPTTGLDPESRAAMWAEIARLSGAEGMTVLLTTHYLEEADRLAAELAIVDQGRVVASGTPDSLKGALKGDVVRATLQATAAPERVRSALTRVALVRDVLVSGRDVTARSDDGAAAVPSVLAALAGAGTPAASVTVARPSLDEVYLRLTGRRYAENGSQAPEPSSAPPSEQSREPFSETVRETAEAK